MGEGTESSEQIIEDEYRLLSLIKLLLCQNYQKELIHLINERLDAIKRIKKQSNSATHISDIMK